jgi:hypothetical protein
MVEQNVYARYRLTPDEETLLLKYRERKSLMEEEAINAGIDPLQVKHFWYKSEFFSIFAKPNQKSIYDLRNELVDSMRKYSPKYPKIVYKKNKDAHLLVIDPADIHIGKLASDTETGEVYNVDIALFRIMEGVRGILDYVKGFKIDQILYIGGNDILHTDNTRRTTTSGTPQDTDGMWYDNFIAAKAINVKVLELLATIAPVHYMHNPSNHDFMTGFFLSDVLQTWFRNHKSITFDCSMAHRKAFIYHKNLIGSTHGDGAKAQDLPLLLAQEYPKEWAETKYRYVYTHHVHHKSSKDYIGVTVESSRSASGTDAWHHRNGYQHAKKAIEAYLHDKECGQIARFTYNF